VKFLECQPQTFATIWAVRPVEKHLWRLAGQPLSSDQMVDQRALAFVDRCGKLKLEFSERLELRN
jgi:hypothetical protein